MQMRREVDGQLRDVRRQVQQIITACEEHDIHHYVQPKLVRVHASVAVAVRHVTSRGARDGAEACAAQNVGGELPLDPCEQYRVIGSEVDEGLRVLLSIRGDQRQIVPWREERRRSVPISDLDVCSAHVHLWQTRDGSREPSVRVHSSPRGWRRG
eukprot:4881579-Prymnesium_polylepis.1